MQDRRKYPRVDISFPVECDILPRGGYFYTVSKDLSLGGLKIISNKFLPRNDAFKITINLIEKVVSLKARVAWCNETRASDTYYAGLEFIGENRASQNEILRFLNRVNM